jgi:hypothetical protein
VAAAAAEAVAAHVAVLLLEGPAVVPVLVAQQAAMD